jgi:two-component system chemotaxis response regulator CheY
MAIDILIVDDSVTIRAMIKKALQLCLPDLGNVMEAENGISALARLAEKRVDLILTDINMPRMDGAQLIEKIKRMPKLADIPIIVVSTDGSQERIEELEQHNVQGYLHKPFRPEQLKELLSRILETANDRTTENSVGCDF